ncbi:MAG: hypothetical protein RLY86_4274 [Pseudomonadota bacterium]|jgi:hypothetical protein
MTTPMGIDRFADLLDRHGPNGDAWPVADRAPALALIARDAEAASLLEAARLVEAVLAAPPDPASPALRRAVLDVPMHHPRTAAGMAGLGTGWLRIILGQLETVLGRGPRVARAGAGMALATGLLGFMLGYGQIVTPPGLRMTGPTDTAMAEGEAAPVSAEQELALLIDSLYAMDDLP